MPVPRAAELLGGADDGQRLGAGPAAHLLPPHLLCLTRPKRLQGACGLRRRLWAMPSPFGSGAAADARLTAPPSLLLLLVQMGCIPFQRFNPGIYCLSVASAPLPNEPYRVAIKCAARDCGAAAAPPQAVAVAVPCLIRQHDIPLLHHALQADQPEQESASCPERPVFWRSNRPWLSSPASRHSLGAEHWLLQRCPISFTPADTEMEFFFLQQVAGPLPSIFITPTVPYPYVCPHSSHVKRPCHCLRRACRSGCCTFPHIPCILRIPCPPCFMSTTAVPTARPLHPAPPTHHCSTAIRRMMRLVVNHRAAQRMNRD